MNKLVIPTILIAVIMIAGAFAFVPIGQAATVHNDIIDSMGILLCEEIQGNHYHPGEADPCHVHNG